MPAKTPKRSKKSNSKKRPVKRKRQTAKPQPLLIRTSERSSHEACPWQWGMGYIHKLSPRREAPALRFGTLVHKALEKRYPPGIKRGPKPAETFEKLFQKERAETESKWKMKVEDDWEDALVVGIDMMEAFIEKYGRDEDWRVIQSEMTFKVPVYLSADGAVNNALLVNALLEAKTLTKKQVEGKDPLFYYVGTMDGVWENRMDGGVRVVDWKTTSSDPIKEAAGKAALDEQTTAYWTWGVDYLIGQTLLKQRQQQALDGMLFNWLRKAKRDTRPTNADGLALNQDGSISKKQPPPMFHRDVMHRSEIEQDSARERAIQQVLTMMAKRVGLLPIYKTPGTGYPSQQCNACAFRDICEVHEAGGDWELMRDSSMDKWNPYGDHEIKEEGKAR